jgi:two-component system chemotaxis sensor kinase CheA
MNDFDSSEYIELFLAEAREHLATLGRTLVLLESDPGNRENIDEIFRAAHSFKGMAATMGFDQLAELTHALEDLIDAARTREDVINPETIDAMLIALDTLEKMVKEVQRSGAPETDPTPIAIDLRNRAKSPATEPRVGIPAHASVKQQGVQARATARGDSEEAREASEDIVAAAVEANRQQSTVRVEAERLDHLLHMMGELVVRRSRVEQVAQQLESAELQQAVDEMTRTSQTVQDLVMRVRMIPVDTAFARIPRLVRDLSRQLDKQVQLELYGQDTELDRTAVDALIEPLMHLVRNAIDHGIESPAARAAADKPESGKLVIEAHHEGGEVVISVGDDGAGIDTEAVLRKALELGLTTAATAQDVTPDEAVEFLFQPGFSTAEEISEVSGRGVGMDAVRAAVRSFGGDVVLRSRPGVGTITQLRMPLTLAIMPALVVTAAGEPYAIQLDRVERTHPIEEINVRRAAGKPVAVFEDRAVPVVNLADRFGRRQGNPRFMVTVQSADRQLALTVDELVGRRELVTRPVPPRIRADLPVSGGAVLASGEIALIVDCEALVRTGSISHA